MPVKRKCSPARRVLGWTVILLLYAAVLALACFGVRMAWKGFAPGLLPVERIDRLGFAVLLLALPALLAKILLANKLRKGRFFPPRQRKTGELAMCSIERGVRKTSPPGWILITLTWANIAVRSSEAPVWKRAAAGGALLLAGAGLLALIAMSAASFIGGIAFGGFMIAVGVAIGLLCLFFPARAIWLLVQRKRRTGSLRSSVEELDVLNERQAQWSARQAAQPLRSKLMGAAGVALVLAWLWLHNWGRRSHDPAWWSQPAMFTAFALFSLVPQFRRQKSAAASS